MEGVGAMKQISVSAMEDWLYRVMETERQLIVVKGAIPQLDSEIRSCKTKDVVEEPEKETADIGTMLVISGFIALVLWIAFLITFFVIHTQNNDWEPGDIPFLNQIHFLPFGDDNWRVTVQLPFELFVVIAVALISSDIAAIKKSNSEKERDYDAKVALANERFDVAMRKVPALTRQMDQFMDVANQLADARDRLYAMDYLPTDSYHGFVPVAAMYGYLKSGRVTVVYGHGGIIDTFVHDSQFEMLNSKLDTIIKQLDLIRASQHELAVAIEKTRREQERISSDILQATRESAGSMAEMAACQRYSAECLSWIATVNTYAAYRR